MGATMRTSVIPEQIALARNIVAARERLGLNQSELARRAGMNRGYLIMLEGATANPSLIKIADLARTLNMTVRELLAD